jgi:two-component system response regulator BaeR
MTQAKPKVLIIEDERKLAALLSEYLERDGFDARVLGDGATAVATVRADPPNLILLDLNLPGVDGITICRKIREFSTVPIIMVTARVEEVDRLLGLELGADDYICKPYSPREVVARVKTVLRRLQAPRTSAVITIGNLSLDPEQRVVSFSGETIQLTRAEFELLHMLMDAPHRVFSRKQLLERISGTELEAYERTVDSHVKNLRKKLTGLSEDDWLVTVYGVGYRFSAA